MSKAEDLAKAFLKKLVSHTTLYKGTIDEIEVYEPYDVIWAYIAGYHQAEKDMELTWEDMLRIDEIISEVYKDSNSCNTENIYQEVLKRFKDFKERKEK